MFKKNVNNPDSKPSGKRWTRVLALGLGLVAVFAATFGISFAMYQSSASVDFGTAGVAAYAVSAAPAAGFESTKALAIDCNEATNNSADYRFLVKNTTIVDGVSVTAEVDLMYSVQVALAAPLPDGVTMTLDGAAGTANGNTYTFTNSDWSFKNGSAASNEHTLTFAADPRIIETSLTVKDIVITVMTEQID